MTYHADSSAQRRLGVIEVLSRGSQLAFRRPWLLALPELRNRLLWSAPRISIWDRVADPGLGTTPIGAGLAAALAFYAAGRGQRRESSGRRTA